MGNYLPFDKRVQIVSALVEGCSMRATERMCEVSHTTVINQALIAGEACRRLHNAMMRGLQVAILELDEIWAFIGKKQKRLTDEDPPEMGDCYTFIALAATQKAIVSYLPGKRDALTANDFVTDLRGRIVNRPQISTDGLTAYLWAIGAAFGAAVDYAQIIKEYGMPVDDERRYSPPKCKVIQRRVISGEPDRAHISTSYIERQNLTCRMHMRRFTRLTNGFSKRARNHAASVALYVAWYNFCRVHETLKTTPAVMLDVADHVWSVAELLDAALAIAPEDAPRLMAPAPPGAEPLPDEPQLDLFAPRPARSMRPAAPSEDMMQLTFPVEWSVLT